MSYISTKAKLGIPLGKVHHSTKRNRKTQHGYNYTNFSGSYSAPMTKERYSKAMRLSRKMRNMNAW